MSVPITNNIIPQNIVINQVPMQHTIMTSVNANNGIPLATAIQHTNSTLEHTSKCSITNP